PGPRLRRRHLRLADLGREAAAQVRDGRVPAAVCGQPPLGHGARVRESAARAEATAWRNRPEATRTNFLAPLTACTAYRLPKTNAVRPQRKRPGHPGRAGRSSADPPGSRAPNAE